MTDAEIRAELARQIEAEGRTVEVDSPTDGPPLIILVDRKLSVAAFHNLREEIRQAWTRGETGPKFLVLPAGLSLFQLIDGRWQEIRPAKGQSECSPVQ